MKKLILISTMLLLLAGACFLGSKKQLQQPRQADGIIRGYVYADVTNTKQVQEHVFLPDVTVTVKDGAGATVDVVQTKLDGSYQTKHIKNGKYRICLSKNGFIESCYDDSIVYASNHPGPLKLNYNRDNFIWGSVKLRDGSAGYYHQQVFGVDIYTKVNVKTATVSTTTRCNVYGYYLIPGVSPRDKGDITAKCENSIISATLGGQPRIDMVFRNSNPQITSVLAYNDAGRSLLRAHTGKKVKLVAVTKDAENNALHYKWIPFGDFPGFVSQDAPQVEWQLPAKAGKYEMDLMVFDRLGGVSYRNYTVVAGDGTVNFSGTVSSIDGSGRIPNALIRVNGKYSTTADAKGYFSIKVPENDNEAYVLNVIKAGYSLFSKVYFNEAVQKEYKLVPSTTQTFDPTGDIAITEGSDKFTHLKGNEGRRNPAHLFIPKNSIVDSSGRHVTTQVTVSVRSIDITDPTVQMPGNYGAVSDGKPVRLESFGAVDVQVRDKAHPETKYNLADTSHASLFIPILASQQGVAKSNIPLWDYNETTGTWEKVGGAQIEKQSFTADKVAVPYYKGITNKFSVLNADFEFTSGTYIVLKDNPSNSVFSHAGPISIKLFAPQASGGVVQGFHVIDNLTVGDLNSGNGLPVVNLPANTVITVQIISNGTVINTINPRTGPVIPGSVSCCPPPSPTPPYDPTAEAVFMLPDNLTLAQAQLDQFLTAEQNLNGSTDADNYYTLIGAYTYTSSGNPSPHHITFDEWKAKNEYNAVDGSGDVNSVYFNAGDLAFWRGMHQKTAASGKISYYVSNFTTDVDCINNVNAIATVCMEYAPLVAGGGNVNVTKFYVFNGTGNLVNAANLDGNPVNGLKFIPGLCITCHGGNANLDYSSFANSGALQTYFNGHVAEVPNYLPFDAKSFFYSTASGYIRTDQEDHIRLLNNTVLSTQTTTAITGFINAAYNSNSNSSGQGFIDNAVVDVGGASNTWNTTTLVNTVNPSHFYVDVVGTSCRTCHIARTDPNIWFDTKAKFIAKSFTINLFVCPATPNRFMPNSKVTYQNFWTSEAPKRYEEVGKLINQPCN
jgi:hypothetical protein